MYNQIITHIKLTQFLVLIAFIFLLIKGDLKLLKNKIVFLILLFSLTTEVIALLFIIVNKYKYISLLYTLNAIAHNSLWLFLFSILVNKVNQIITILFLYLLFSLVNIIIQGIDHFNNYTFIIGAILFLIIYIKESFLQLKKENLAFFYTNNYILLSAPLLFFLGYSIISGFNNRSLSSTLIFEKIALYDLIGYFINLVYYTLIIVYIYKENKSKYVKS